MNTSGGDLARGARLMTIGTAISRVTGFGRTLALAYALGSTALADSYNLANNAPNIVYELVLGGVLAGTLLPVFAQYFSNEDEDGAWRAISAVFTLATTCGLVLVLFLFIGAPWVIDLYTSSESEAYAADREVATTLLRFFSVQVFFYALISVATALLHTRRSFGPPMFAPIFNNLVVIAMLIAVPFVANDLDLSAVQANTALIVLLGLGTSGGVLAMALVLLPYLKRVGAGRLRWHWEPRHPIVTQILRLSGWTAGFVVANQVAFFVTIRLAFGGQDADLTAYLYAYTFFVLPHGIFAVSVMSALQPGLAEASATRAWSDFRHRFGQGLRLILLVIVPAAAGYAVLASPIVDIVLNYGNYGASATETTADLVAFLVIGLPGFSAFLYLARCFQAMQDTRAVFFLYVLENGVNIVTAFPLYDAMGVQGLALSHSIAYSVGAVAGFIWLRRRLSGFDGSVAWTFVWRLLAVTVAMTALVAVTVAVLENSWFEVIVGCLIGALSFVGITKALQLKELNLLLRRSV